MLQWNKSDIIYNMPINKNSMILNFGSEVERESKMSYVCISKVYEKFLIHINEELLTKNIIEGCKSNILDYIKRVAPDAIMENEDRLLVEETLISRGFIDKYYEKCELDFSAKDCAHIALKHVGIPPIEYMSVDSLEKTIRELFKEYKGKVYIKRSKGKGSAFCVDFNTAISIVNNPDVLALLNKQASKAERKHEETGAWRAYEFEKKKIASIESSCTDNNDTGYSSRTLSVNEKTYLMVEAIYRKLFSDFDYVKYEKYCDEMEILDDNWDFGERYQELYAIFSSHNYMNEFYEFEPKDDVLDALADILAEKIVKKISEKRS